MLPMFPAMHVSNQLCPYHFHGFSVMVLLVANREGKKDGPTLRWLTSTVRGWITQPRTHFLPSLYRVTHPVVQNLPLTSKQKFRLDLAWSGQAKAELLF